MMEEVAERMGFYGVQPDTAVVFCFGSGQEVLRITKDSEVIVAGDVYEAAKGFWEAVQQTAPEGWTVKQAAFDAPGVWTPSSQPVEDGT